MEQKIKCSRDELGGGTAVSKAKWQATGNGRVFASLPSYANTTPREHGPCGSAGNYRLELVSWGLGQPRRGNRSRAV